MQITDLLLLLFKGVAVASFPLLLVWAGVAKRRGDDRLRRLAWVTAFFTFDLIVFGGFTRLSDAGLGCPDWPGCYAKASPLMAATDIRNAEALIPTGPVTMTKAWIEMIHRYLAMGVGVLIIVLLAWSVVRWRRNARADRAARPASPGLVLALLALVCAQGAFGAWTVTMKLQPVIVTTHLLLGMTLLATLVWHALRLGNATAVDGAHGVPEGGRGVRALAVVGAVVLAIQIALGGWVSTNYAVLACADFPLCQGALVPEMDFANGFHLWRELGKTGDGANLGLSALTAIHWVHRGFSLLVFALLGALSWRAWTVPALKKPALFLAVVLAAQFATGLVNVVYAWPLAAAVLHNAGTAALVAVLLVLNYKAASTARSSRAPQGATLSSRRPPVLREPQRAEPTLHPNKPADPLTNRDSRCNTPLSLRLPPSSRSITR